MWIKQHWHMPEDLKKLGLTTFEQAMQLQGKIFRDVPGRKTMQIALDSKSYFIKQHFGVGWGEIFKNLLSFKTPIIGAMTEVEAIQKLVEIGVPTTPLVAYGQQGCSPACFNIASLRSFVITEDLGNIISLEDLCADWKTNPPDAAFKNKLIIAIARTAAKIHAAGLCHRDFYLCHLVIKKQDLENEIMNLYLIDLHRMLQVQKANSSAIMKDVAGLIFSAMDSGFDEADWGLFRQYYLPQSSVFWDQASGRAQQLYRKFHSVKFQTRLAQEKSAINS